MSTNEMEGYGANRRMSNLAGPAITAPLRISSWRLIAIAILSMLVGLCAALAWIYFKYSSPWFTADNALDSVHIPREILESIAGGQSSGGGYGGSFQNMFEALGEAFELLKTVIPVMMLVLGMVVSILNRSFVPLLGAMFLGPLMFLVINIVTSGHVSGVDPRKALLKSVTALEFKATRARFDELRVPAPQRDYILGQMFLLDARKTPAKPIDQEVIGMVERAGYGFVNLGKAGMSWSVLYKMERESFGEVRSDTAKAYAKRVREMQAFLLPIVWAAAGVALIGLLGSMLLGILARQMKRRAKRIEGLSRDVRIMRDQFAKDSMQSS